MSKKKRYNRRALVTKAPELALELVNPNSSLMQTVDAIDSMVVAASQQRFRVKRIPKVVLEFRKAVSALCPHYSPCAEQGQPFYPDGQGILCASGTPGYAVMRGSLCTKACRLADPTVNKRDFIPVAEVTQIQPVSSQARPEGAD